MTDYHCHILPDIDDGSKSVEMSLEMIKIMKSQGVERIVATPHFYAHREQDIDSYLKKRQTAYNKPIQAKPVIEDIRLGSEVAIEYGLSKLDGIEKLRFEGTNYILLEPPYAKYEDWVVEEIENIKYEYNLTPIIAHIHRYINRYSKAEMQKLLDIDAVLQFNCEALKTFREKRFIKQLIKDGYPYIFGSDSHNLDERRPNWDLFKSKSTKEMLNNVADI